MLAKKLHVREGSRVAVLGAPATIDLVLPPGVFPAKSSGPADIVLAYAKNAAAVRPALARAGKILADGGALWIAYPKAGQLGTDLNRDVLARALQADGLEPVGQIAVDGVWSALRVKRDEALSAARKARGTFAAKKPAATKAAPKKLAAKQPVATKGTPKKPTAKKSAAAKVAPGKTVATKPVATKGTPKKPAAKQSVATKAATKKPAATKATPKKPAARKR